MPKDRKKKASSSDDSDSGPDDRLPPAKKSKTATSSSSRTEDKEPTWTLAKNKLLKVRQFKGKTYIDIREYYMSDKGDFLPGKKGISMTPEMWQKLKSVIDEVDEELKNV